MSSSVCASVATHCPLAQSQSQLDVSAATGKDLQQPTASEAAREEEQFGLNTPAPGKEPGQPDLAQRTQLHEKGACGATL